MFAFILSCLKTIQLTNLPHSKPLACQWETGSHTACYGKLCVFSVRYALSHFIHETDGALCEAEERLEHDAAQRDGGTPTDTNNKWAFIKKKMKKETVEQRVNIKILSLLLFSD